MVPRPLADASGRPLQFAAGFRLGRRRLVAGHDLIDAEEVLGVVLALLLRLADEGRGHQLMVALAVVALVRLQLHFGRQLEIAQRPGKLERIERFLSVGDEREGVRRGIAEPMACRRHLAAGLLAGVGGELLDMPYAPLRSTTTEHPPFYAPPRPQRLPRFQL